MRAVLSSQMSWKRGSLPGRAQAVPGVSSRGPSQVSAPLLTLPGVAGTHGPRPVPAWSESWPGSPAGAHRTPPPNSDQAVLLGRRQAF